MIAQIKKTVDIDGKISTELIVAASDPNKETAVDVIKAYKAAEKELEAK